MKSQRKSVKLGKAGESIAQQVLSSRGIDRVRTIGTPFTITAKQGRWLQGFYGQKVAGDTTGIIDGTFVLAETKTIMEGNLSWSAFSPHQPGELSDHVQHGGIALVVWVHNSGVKVLSWPIPGLEGPKTSITPEQADELDILDIRSLLSQRNYSKFCKACGWFHDKPTDNCNGE